LTNRANVAKVTIALAGGDLELELDKADLPITELCGFASRRNPKRPFLFVSRVLGRHLPVRPTTMRDVHLRLAAKLPTDLPTPAVVIGMAETAVALGQGVHEAWQDLTCHDDLLFLPSTRYRLDRPLLGTFEEGHSHATEHLLYEPADPRDRDLLARARTLILVDDEASTGATFAALVAACRPVMPALARVACVTITDWMGADRRAALRARLPVPAEMISLLSGRYTFHPGTAPPPRLPDVVGNGGLKDHLMPVNWGRLGLRTAVRLPDHVLTMRARRGERILVLGTGEFVYPPYQLARRLAAQGAEVWVQATTRSPILEGADIQSVLEFPDAYDDGIPNYLYGVRPGQYDRVLVCYETPPAMAQRALLDTLAAQPVYFNHRES